jgi:glutamate/tyrosine decarboxylase-like PLP-dependent enzyme
MPRQGFPVSGRNGADVLADLARLQAADVPWEAGLTWAFVYHGDDDVYDVASRAYASAAPLNALGNEAFTSLAAIERDLVAMLGNLLGAPDAAGSATSGGSESIFLAVKSARDRLRGVGHRGRVEILVPTTAHPAFDKAAHYLDVTVRKVPVAAHQRADVAAMRSAVTPDTAMIVGSAPSYPHGVVDPIGEIGAVAAEHDLWFHVDACVGGFVLPFIDPADRTIPVFDFRVPAVRSMSLDPHKYGYALKGISMLLHRDADGFAYQKFAVSGWPGGSYETPNLTGTRPGAPMTSAWAVINHLGRDGFERLVKRAVDATDRLADGISSLPGFFVPVAPQATLLAFASDRHDITAVAEGLRQRGWVLGVQGPPPSIHLTVSPNHDQIVEKFVTDLAAAAADAEAGRLAPGGEASFRYA